jgi:hypothetical protein
VTPETNARGTSPNDAVDPISIALSGPAPEVEIARDIARRGVLVAPVIIGVAWLIWGPPGAWSALFAVALILGNFIVSAGLIAITARISLGLMMGAILFGYLIRLGIVFSAVWIVRDQPWISIPALAAAIIVTYLGLLVWEMKYVSITMSHSGLRSTRPAPRATEEIESPPTHDPAATPSGRTLN